MPLTAVVAVVAGLVALTDWWAVRVDLRKVEQFAKPLVMVALIVLALSLPSHPSIARWFFVGGLVFGLVGDILLLPAVGRFVPGLVAFLIGHVCYVGGLSTMALAPIGVLGGVAAALVLMVYLGWPVIAAVRGTPLGIPVMVYMAAVSALVIVGTATHRWPIALGGVAFAVSDGLLGRDRFVTPTPRLRFVVHMLYHVGQFGLVLGLSTPTR